MPSFDLRFCFQRLEQVLKTEYRKETLDKLERLMNHKVRLGHNKF